MHGSRVGACHPAPRPYLITSQAMRDNNATRIHSHLSAMRVSVRRANADRCLSVLLCLQRLRTEAQAIGWRLLRVLFVRVGALPAGPAKRERPVLPVMTRQNTSFGI